jgi:hypothetical protein
VDGGEHLPELGEAERALDARLETRPDLLQKAIAKLQIEPERGGGGFSLHAALLASVTPPFTSNLAWTHGDRMAKLG